MTFTRPGRRTKPVDVVLAFLFVGMTCFLLGFAAGVLTGWLV